MMTGTLRTRLLTSFLALALLALGALPAHSQQADGSSEAENETEAMAEQLLDRIHRFRLRNFMALDRKSVV